MLSSTILKGRRILVLEDDYWIMAELVRDLREWGADLVGPFSGIEQALDALAGNQVIDGAVIDVNVQGTKAFAVADALVNRQIPFVFATGYDTGDIEEAYGDIPVFQKPIAIEQIAESLLAHKS